MSKIKNKVLTKIVVFCFLSLFWVFYPGQNALLTQANLNLPAFVKKKDIEFTPKPLPQLKSPFPQDQIMAESFLVIDLSSFTPIVSHQADKKMYPASLVKLATAMVSYKHYALKQNLTVKKVIDEELKMGLVKGEKISVLNLLYGILVYSANDAAYTLAENYPGKVQQFVKEMNLLAKNLQMRNTYFVNPIGFDSQKQYSTAFDLAILSKEFVKNPVLLNIASTKSITVSDANFEHFHYLNSNNQLLGEIPHLGGLKTGTTDKAGQNLISFYRFGQNPIIIVLLKSQDRFTDSQILIDYLNSNLIYQKII